MSSVSTTLEAITSTSAVADAMNLVVEKLDDAKRVKLTQWMKVIEEYADGVVRSLTPAQMKRRKIEVVAAAAVYDAFLEFESRTGMKLGLPQMQDALDISQCSINTTWNKLFDNRGTLRGDQLDVVYISKDGSISEAITNVIQALAKAVDRLTPKRIEWLENIKTEAIELSQLVPQNIVKRYETLTGAVTIIYAAIQLHHGKMQVRIAQRDLSLLSATSPALISKCWIDLFEKYKK